MALRANGQDVPVNQLLISGISGWEYYLPRGTGISHFETVQGLLVRCGEVGSLNATLARVRCYPVDVPNRANGPPQPHIEAFRLRFDVSEFGGRDLLRPTNQLVRVECPCAFHC